MLEKVRFDMIYSFIYSPRELTPAAKMDCQIPDAEKSRRMNRLLEVQNKISYEINLAAVGTAQRVLLEGVSQKSEDMLTGRAELEQARPHPENAGEREADRQLRRCEDNRSRAVRAVRRAGDLTKIAIINRLYINFTRRTKTMEVMELAAELGKLIKKDPRVVEMTRAERKHTKRTRSSRAQSRSTTPSLRLSAQSTRSRFQDNEFIKIIENRIHDLYNEIMSNPNMLAYTKAQDAVNEFMNEVDGEITYQITGERPCAHDCSCCEGGCHH